MERIGRSDSPGGTERQDAAVLKIGGASGFWGESPHASAQLLAVEGLDFLVFDYLAEITMSIMARARRKDADAGFATDFVSVVMARNLATIAARGVRVISNAGGVNPRACAHALRALIDEAGLGLRVAVVEGDDLLSRASEFADRKEMFSGAPFPPAERVMSINAYLGAFPIAAALDGGADIVITGRCVDSAVTLGACIHHFGWGAEDWDRLAAGSLAGHLLECGPQSTGGNFTDWRQTGDIARIGYPVAEIGADGDIVLTKPPGTTGTVTPLSVGEQMLYEIGDPRAYVLPDVVCDFSGVELLQIGPDRVQLRGSRGAPPTGMLKVSATWADGWRSGQVVQFCGREARDKALAFAEAGLAHARAGLSQLGLGDFDEVSVETFGGRPGTGDYEEIALKVGVRHADARAVGLWIRAATGVALATPPGLHFFTGAGRPKPSPIVALFSFLLPAGQVPVSVSLDGADLAYRAPSRSCAGPPKTQSPEPPQPSAAGPGEPMLSLPLESLAVARSGDKGDAANIGVMARNPAFLPWIWQALDEPAVAQVFAEELKGEVRRYWLPGSHAMNIVLTQVLGGGGVASLRSDAQGKAFAQRLLQVPVAIPAALAPNDSPLGRGQAEQVGQAGRPGQSGATGPSDAPGPRAQPGQTDPSAQPAPPVRPGHAGQEDR